MEFPTGLVLEMKILYLSRYYNAHYYRRRFSISNAALNGLKNHALIRLSNLRRRFFFSPVDGFFEESLCHSGDVTISHAQIGSRQTFNSYDILVAHFRCTTEKLRGDEDDLIDIAKRFNGPKVLFIDADEAEFMTSDRLIDHYDLVIKREPFIDLDRYGLAPANKDKIRPTMLSCKYFVHSPYPQLCRMRHKSLIEQGRGEPEADLFFIGKATDERLAVWKELGELRDLTLAGGLLPRIGFDNESTVMTTPLNERDYIRQMQRSRISLAVDGHGQFTFRHLEVWCVGGVLLAPAVLKDLWLPLEMKEGLHYFAYDRRSQVTGIVKEILANPKLAAQVAEASRDVFFRDYDVESHGAEIRGWLERLL